MSNLQPTLKKLADKHQA